MHKLLIITTALFTLAACTGPNLEGAVLQGFEAEGACVPPTSGAAIEVYAFDDAVFTVSAQLHAAPTETGSGEVIRAEGIPVAIVSGDVETREVLAESETDAEGRVTLEIDATDLDDPYFGISIDGQDPTQFPYTVIRPRTGLGGDLLCAYWADADGNQLHNARQGDVVNLVVRGEGGLETPSLTIDEVGNDLGGGDRITTFEANPLEDGMSTTEWTVNATGGLFEGPGLELQITASMNVNDRGDAAYARSTWLYTN